MFSSHLLKARWQLFSNIDVLIYMFKTYIQLSWWYMDKFNAEIGKSLLSVFYIMVIWMTLLISCSMNANDRQWLLTYPITNADTDFKKYIYLTYNHIYIIFQIIIHVHMFFIIYFTVLSTLKKRMRHGIELTHTFSFFFLTYTITSYF